MTPSHVSAVEVRQSILIVEDEPKIAALLHDYLEAQGAYHADVLARGDQVEEWLATHTPDLILLDVMLPGLDGLEVCKRVRRVSQVPIIMITARVEEIDRLLGLELGADDYICKPFSPREVVARVRAVLRRGAPGHSARALGLEIDPGRFSATLNGAALTLTPVEFALLHALSAQAGRIFSRQQLMDVMYSDYRVVMDRAVDTHIKNLRKKLAQVVADREFIESVYGLGYRFCV
jgi:two-component system response regulator BaeR